MDLYSCISGLIGRGYTIGFRPLELKDTWYGEFSAYIRLEKRGICMERALSIRDSSLGFNIDGEMLVIQHLREMEKEMEETIYGKQV